jgi:hypothetical protein
MEYGIHKFQVLMLHQKLLVKPTTRTTFLLIANEESIQNPHRKRIQITWLDYQR